MSFVKSLPVIRLKAVIENVREPVYANETKDLEPLILELCGETEEVLLAVYLSVHCEVLGVREIARGTIDTAYTSGREIFKGALLCNAASVILLHNHLSLEKPQCSQADLTLTKQMVQCGALLGVTLSDHLITNQCGQTCSMFTDDPRLFEYPAQLLMPRLTH